jgi:hypothetical protein
LGRQPTPNRTIHPTLSSVSCSTLLCSPLASVKKIPEIFDRLTRLHVLWHALFFASNLRSVTSYKKDHGICRLVKSWVCI